MDFVPIPAFQRNVIIAVAAIDNNRLALANLIGKCRATCWAVFTKAIRGRKDIDVDKVTRISTLAHRDGFTKVRRIAQQTLRRKLTGVDDQIAIGSLRGHDWRAEEINLEFGNRERINQIPFFVDLEQK